jgi:hypothetical protein
VLRENDPLHARIAAWLGLVSWCVVAPGSAVILIDGVELGSPGEMAALLISFAVFGSLLAAAVGFTEIVRMLRAESYERRHLYLALTGLLLGLSGCLIFTTAFVLR